MKIQIVLVAVLSMVVFSACKTSKTVAPVATVVPLKNQAITQLVKELETRQPVFQTANVRKMTMELNLNERTLNVSGSVRLRKDSAMYVSFQVFGIEVFKAELNPDSVRVFDKMGRRYYVADYGLLSRQFGVAADFYSLQSLLTAQFFCMGQRVSVPDSCKLSPNMQGGMDVLYRSEKIAQTTTVDTDRLIRSVLLKSVDQDYSLLTTYSGYTPWEGVNFPSEINLTASGTHSRASCKFSILKAEFNTALQFQPMNTASYTRGEINQLLSKY